MSVYIPLARRYRPKKFSEVVGQDIVVKILSQALENGRLGSAILLNGTRGIGKTTIARILAKIIRCENPKLDACGECRPCQEFDSNNMDVLEMDAASHTSVDDIREIIDSCKYLPSTGKYKVFIIDEVHMLSKSAFNALLKTLEEPPAHVKFIFATTELYKIPETILSRCLRFDLKRIDVNLLTQFLSGVCTKEGVKFEEGAIRLIAKVANGSIRDSLSILEQAINVSDSELMESQIREMLGGMSYSDALELLRKILDSDAKSAVSMVRTAILGGTSPGEVINTIMNLVHKMTCLRVGANYFGDCVLPHDDELGLAILAKSMPLSRLSTLWQMLVHGANENHDADNKAIALEMIIIRLCYAASLPDLAEIIEGKSKKKQLERPNERQLMENTLAAIKKERTLKDEALQMFKGSYVTS